MRERPERLPRAVLQGGLAVRPLRRLERFLARVGRFLPGTTGRLPLREKVTLKVNGIGFRDKPERVYRYFVETTGRTPVRVRRTRDHAPSAPTTRSKSWSAPSANVRRAPSPVLVTSAIGRPQRTVPGERESSMGRNSFSVNSSPAKARTHAH